MSTYPSQAAASLALALAHCAAVRAELRAAQAALVAAPFDTPEYAAALDRVSRATGAHARMRRMERRLVAPLADAPDTDPATATVRYCDLCGYTETAPACARRLCCGAPMMVVPARGSRPDRKGVDMTEATHTHNGRPCRIRFIAGWNGRQEDPTATPILYLDVPQYEAVPGTPWERPNMAALAIVPAASLRKV